MNRNTLNVVTNIWIILFCIIFIPFIGVILLLVRCFTNANKKFNINIFLIIIGLLILLPNFLFTLLSDINVGNDVIAFVESIVNTSMYTRLYDSSYFIIGVGIMFLLINAIISKFVQKIIDSIKKYIKDDQDKNYKIDKENDLKIKEKQEKFKNSHVVTCKHCGANNILEGTFGTCKYCRNNIYIKDSVDK